MRHVSLIAALACTSLIAGRSQAQQLSPAEQKMRNYVRAHVGDETAFLAKVVDINSGTLNQAGVRAAGDAFASELQSLGFETRWVSLPPELKRAGHLFAEHIPRKGKASGKTVLLLGHLDTVFEGEAQKWTIIDDSTAKGAGSGDMKGGDVAFLWALKAMKAAGTLDDTHIIVALTGDEEAPGKPDSISRHDLVAAAKRSDAVLAFEGDAGKATIARRGFSAWQVTVKARQSHSAGVFTKGAGFGAIYEVSRILDGFREALSNTQYLTLNPGAIVGGTNVSFDSLETTGTAAGKLNIIAPTAIVQGDLRFMTPGQLDSARSTMRAIVSRSLPGTSATISFTDGNPAMPPTKGNYALLATLDGATRALGQGPTEALDPGLRGGGDISFIAEYADGIDGLGVRGNGAHSPDETVNLKSIPVATERAAVFINRVAHERKKK